MSPVRLTRRDAAKLIIPVVENEGVSACTRRPRRRRYNPALRVGFLGEPAWAKQFFVVGACSQPVAVVVGAFRPRFRGKPRRWPAAEAEGKASYPATPWLQPALFRRLDQRFQPAQLPFIPVGTRSLSKDRRLPRLGRVEKPMRLVTTMGGRRKRPSNGCKLVVLKIRAEDRQVFAGRARRLPGAN